jgi:hypothetical protein
VVMKNSLILLLSLFLSPSRTSCLSRRYVQWFTQHQFSWYS